MEQALDEAVSRLSSLYMIACLLGLTLLLLLAASLARAFKAGRLIQYRSKANGLADMFNSAYEPRNGVIACKNGALAAAFSYEGADISSITNFDRNVTSERLNKLFSGMDSGWMFHIDAIRTSVPKYPDPSRCSFPDRISAAIDEERRRYFNRSGNSYESKFVMTVTWLPPLKKAEKIQKILYTGGAPEGSAREQSEKLVNEFEAKLEGIRTSLSVIFTNVRRLETTDSPTEKGNVAHFDDLLSWFYFCVTGIWQPILRPETPVYLDTILAAQDLVSGFNFTIGRKWVKVLSIEGLAGTTVPGMLTMLGELACEYRFSTRFIALDANEATSLLARYRRKWAIKERGLISVILDRPGKINQDAAEMVQEADDATAAVAGGLVSWGFVTQCLIFMDEDPQRLEENVRYATAAIEKLGLTCRVEKQNSMDAFFGSLPTHGYENVRRPLVSTENLADIIPVSTPWTGSADAPCDFYPEKSPCLMEAMTGASDSTVFRFNFHVKDLGHTLVLGPTGAGKSTFLCITAAQALRYKGMKIYSFDKGYSMYALCRAVGGKHFVPGKDSALSFCPLGSIEDASDEAWASEWLQMILEVNGVEATPKRTNAINETLSFLVTSHKDDPATGMSLTVFASQVQDDDVRGVLKQYLAKESSTNLIDAEKDGLSMSPFSVFEIEPLMNMGNKYCLPVLSYLFHRIEKSLDGSPVIIYLDEAWLMLGHPAFAGKIREWLKVMRKKNCAIVMATQSLADLKESPIYSTLIESTATKVFLPNPAAVQESMLPMYRDFGLNDRQIITISQGIKKLNYFVVQENSSRMINLKLGPLALAFCGVSDPDTIKRINALIEACGPDKWQEEWLAENHLILPGNLRYGK